MHRPLQKEILETQRVASLIVEPRPPIKMTIFCPWFSKKARASSSRPLLSVDSIVCQSEFQLIAFCVAAGGCKLHVATWKRRNEEGGDRRFWRPSVPKAWLPTAVLAGARSVPLPSRLNAPRNLFHAGR